MTAAVLDVDGVGFTLWTTWSACPRFHIPPFLIKNSSSIRLPYISIRVRDKSQKYFDGGIWLAVKDIAPGQQALVSKECYKGIVDPGYIEFYSKDDPTPDDRERYWEFKKPS